MDSDRISLKRTTVKVMNNLWIEFLVRNFIIVLEEVHVLVLPLFCVGSYRQYPVLNEVIFSAIRNQSSTSKSPHEHNFVE